jgi:hypothetical protein
MARKPAPSKARTAGSRKARLAASEYVRELVKANPCVLAYPDSDWTPPKPKRKPYNKPGTSIVRDGKRIVIDYPTEASHKRRFEKVPEFDPDPATRSRRGRPSRPFVSILRDMAIAALVVLEERRATSKKVRTVSAFVEASRQLGGKGVRISPKTVEAAVYGSDGSVFGKLIDHLRSLPDSDLEEWADEFPRMEP